MAEGARLESVYTATYRGFESPPHRHILRRARTQVRAFFSHVAPTGGDENPRPGFDNWQRQLDRPRACERAAPTKTPGAFLNNACVGPAGARPRDGPSNGERSESIPPSPPYFKKSSYASSGFFFACGTADIPGVGSNASPGLPDPTRQVVRPRAVPPGGKSIPPHRHILRRARTHVRAFFSHVAPQTSPGSATMPLPGYQTVPAR